MMCRDPSNFPSVRAILAGDVRVSANTSSVPINVRMTSGWCDGQEYRMTDRRRRLDDLVGPRFSRTEVASHFGKSEKWLRRLLPRVTGIAPIQAGSTMLFTPDDVKLIEAHLRCLCTLAGSGKGSGTRAARSASAKRASSSANTAQAAVRALTQKPRQQPATAKLGRTSLKVVQGGLGG